VAEQLTIIRERYRLDAMIGEGGMASVWRAWDLTLERPIAVKLLFARDARNEDVVVARFLREARIAASVQHRNVIHIVDFGTTPEGQPFMVMELLEGETLAARLRRSKPLPMNEVVQIGNLTLRGLAAVHAAGIIHRDLKPDNVYLKTEGDVVYPKILDFGISRSIEPASGPRSALTTRDGVIVGTPEYMSPEQARGVKQLDYRTDLYSMGVVLYEALTGELPYRSENVGDLIIKIVTGCAPTVHELMPSLPLAMSQVVARAMARIPGDRYPDATAMQEALVAAGQTMPMHSLPQLSDLPPQPRRRLSPVPSYARTTRRPGSPPPRTAAVQFGRPTAEIIADASQREPAPVHSTDTEEQPGTGPDEQRLDEQEEDRTLDSVHDNALARWRRRWSTRWSRPLMAAATLLAVGGLLLWLAPAPRPLPPMRAVVLRSPSRPAAPSGVTLELRGLPADATVTLDGDSASPTLHLPRDARAHSVAVVAPGKLPWHISYVANADQQLDVSLQDEVVAPAQSGKPRRVIAHNKPPRKAQGALREPDF
jgi:serine/threonine protein kinase